MEFSFLDALSTTVIAMTIVFSLLIVLQYIIRFQSFVLSFGPKKAKPQKVEVINKDEHEEMEDESEDDLEVVAVIAAALSAYLDIPESNLKIKSIKRVSSNWSQGI